MAKKKAAIEVQFNWVFVMVAGALILVFFFGVVQKQRELSQAKISNSLLTNLESIATGAGVSKGTVQTVALPNIGIEFECTDECLCTYAIEQIQKEYKDRVIFAPEFVKASGVMLWTLDWKVPFRVTNFVFATTSKDKYFFVYENPNSALYNMLNRTIPPEVNADFVHISQYTALKNENYNSAKFVFVDTSAPIPSDLGIDRSFRRVDVGGVYINSAGDVHFYNKISSRSLTFEKVETSYFGEPAIYGAIFAADSNAYECNMMSALLRMKNILGLYIERTKELDNLNNAAGFCSEGYSTENLENLQAVADTAYRNVKQLKFISSDVASLNSQNDRLLRASCPLLH
jgi:hypothetical protein